jgi:hypothetical protein
MTSHIPLEKWDHIGKIIFHLTIYCRNLPIYSLTAQWILLTQSPPCQRACWGYGGGPSLQVKRPSLHCLSGACRGLFPHLEGGLFLRLYLWSLATLSLLLEILGQNQLQLWFWHLYFYPQSLNQRPSSTHPPSQPTSQFIEKFPHQFL